MKNKIKLKVLFFMMVLASYLLHGCSNSNISEKELVPDHLVLQLQSIGLGGNDELLNTTVTYNLNVWNKSEKPIYIQSIEPLLSQPLKKRLTEQVITMEFNKEIESNTSEVFTGQFILDTEGLTKEQILELNIHIKDFSIITERIISLDKIIAIH